VKDLLLLNFVVTNRLHPQFSLHPYSRCLQLAIPSLSAPERGLYALAGEMPGLARLDALAGCRFAPW